MLGDHDHEREIVHPQSGIEELISINEEDDVLHSVFNNIRVGFYPLKSEVNGDSIISSPANITHRGGEAAEIGQLRDQAAFLQHAPSISS